MDLQLEQDEVMLLDEEGVCYYDGDDGVQCDRLVLTNKNIIRYEEKLRLFKKPEPIVEKMPLTNIVSFNGKPEVFCKKDEDLGKVLHVNFGNRILLFDLGKTESEEWANRIISIIQK